MKNDQEIKTYRISGLDCANCVGRIEGVIRRTEPEARLVIPDGPDGDDGSPVGPVLWQYRHRVFRFGLSLLPVAAGVLFRGSLEVTPYRWAEYAVFLSAYLLAGWPVLSGAFRNMFRGRLFDEMFLMTVATLGAIAIHELAEAVAVMLFYAVGEFFQDLAVDHSRRSISSLMDLRPDFARVVTSEGVREVDPEGVEVGAVIEVLPGERVPLDGDVTAGESSVDTSALTGESVPRSISTGDLVLAGFVNETGRITLAVTSVYAESAVARVLELVETAASRKAPTERFISRFAAVYTPVMVGLAAALAFLPPLLVPGATLGEWVYRALVLLVISCPCALVISIPLGYFGGIGGAARKHILIKGANYMDALKDVSTVVLDKTGTLTEGVFVVTDTVGRNGFSGDEVLQWAAAAEAHSTHPIARSIRRAFEETGTDVTVTEVSEERGYGIAATIDGRRVLAGSRRLLDREGIAWPEELDDGTDAGTMVHIAVDGVYAGYVLIADRIKAEAVRAVAALKALGVRRTVMLTGDNQRIAATVAAQLGIGKFRAELLPQDKVQVLEELKGELPPGERLAFVGDGINDAPVLMRSDVGFAMGDIGSDAAIEAADVVIMDDRLEGVPEAIGIARYTRKIVIQNIVFALGIKAVFLGLGAIGIAGMWEAVIADVGVAILAVLNATRTLRGAVTVRSVKDGVAFPAPEAVASGQDLRRSP